LEDFVENWKIFVETLKILVENRKTFVKIGRFCRKLEDFLSKIGSLLSKIGRFLSKNQSTNFKVNLNLTRITGILQAGLRTFVMAPAEFFSI